MFSTVYSSTQPPASTNYVIYATRYARGVNHVTSHLLVMLLDSPARVLTLIYLIKNNLKT